MTVFVRSEVFVMGIQPEVFGFKRLSLDNWLTVDPTWAGIAMSSSLPNPSEAWVFDLVQSELSPAVPVNIRRLFQIARGTLVYSLMFYPLLTRRGRKPLDRCSTSAQRSQPSKGSEYFPTKRSSTRCRCSD
jgi:hypothetical protein